MTYPIFVSFCLVILVSASLSEHFELSSPLFVIGNVGQDVILPSQISPAIQSQNTTVQWFKTVNGSTEIIYQYTSFSGQEMFGQGYKEKAVFFKEGLTSGNVSLKLKTLRIADEGSYKCKVMSIHWGAQVQTVLHVATPTECCCSGGSQWFPAFLVAIILLILLVLGIIIYHFTYKKKRENVTPTKDLEEEKNMIPLVPKEPNFEKRENVTPIKDPEGEKIMVPLVSKKSNFEKQENVTVTKDPEEEKIMVPLVSKKSNFEKRENVTPTKDPEEEKIMVPLVSKKSNFEKRENVTATKDPEEEKIMVPLLSKEPNFEKRENIISIEEENVPKRWGFSSVTSHTPHQNASIVAARVQHFTNLNQQQEGEVYQAAP